MVRPPARLQIRVCDGPLERVAPGADGEVEHIRRPDIEVLDIAQHLVPVLFGVSAIPALGTLYIFAAVGLVRVE